MKQFLVLAFLACSTISRDAAGDEPCDVRAETSERAAAKLALLVGVGDYQSGSRINDLSGPPNDVAAIKNLLVGKFDFAPEDIKVLVDAQATRDGIIGTFCQHLIARARAGDTVVFYYSGHGSQMGDREPFDETVDGYDETLVPHDARQGGVLDIRDDELNTLLGQLGTDNVTVILDSCHSGAAARLASGVPRRVEPADDPRFPPGAPGPTAGRAVAATDSLRSPEARYALITGTSADQLSFEKPFAGTTHGALTYFLVRALDAAAPDATYRDVFEPVAAQVTAEFPSQRPQLEGVGRNNFVLQGVGALAAPYILAAPEGDVARLAAGSASGVTEGSVYAVYPPGTRDFAAATEVATVEVTQVRAFESTAGVTEGRIDQPASRAVEVAHQHVGSPLTVFSEVGGEMAAAIGQALAGTKHNVELVTAKEGAKMVLGDVVPPDGDTGGLDRAPEIALHFADGSQASPGIEREASDAAQRIADQLRQWAKWFNVLEITNSRAQLRARVEVVQPEGGQPAASGDQAGALEIGDGDRFVVKVRNTNKDEVYVHVLGLFADGSIAPVFPPDGSAQPLPRGQEWSEEYEAENSSGRETRDFVKVIVSSEPIDTRVFEQEGIKDLQARGEPLSPLEQLLADASEGTRAFAQVRVSDWLTDTRSVVVTPRAQ
jgi:hypothetical protein